MCKPSFCITGFVLITVCIIICIISGLDSRPDKSVRYKNTGCLQQMTKDISYKTDGNIHVNTATAEELTELPGIGETLAEMIIAERIKNGKYYYPEDLEAVRGIGPMTVRRFLSMVDLSQDESED